MAVLGPTVVGLFAYLSGNQGAGDATFLPEILFSNVYFLCNISNEYQQEELNLRGNLFIDDQSV
jgi:hypothetical protein